MICMRCNKIFNFKKKLREHVREQHAKKLINSSSLSINTLKLVCEDEEKSAFDDSSVSSNFETITSSKISHLSSSASESVSELMKNTSIQCSSTSSRSLSTQTFESEHQEISVQKSSEFCSSLSIDTVKSVCEIQKKSTIIETFALQASHISSTTSRSQIAFEITSSKDSNLSTEAFKIVSKSMKKKSNQEITCVRVICKLCKQNFNFNKKLYEHIRNHEDLKLVKKSHLSINAVNLVCEIEKISLASHRLSASSAKSQKSIFESAIAFRTVNLLKRSNLSSSTFETKSKSTKKSTTYQHYKRLSSEQKVE